MKKTLAFACLCIAFLAMHFNLFAQTLAFPGAEGFGRFALGGRGGSVYYVTSLLDDGSVGTFRDALKAGNRTILFKVSGTIFLTKPLVISYNNTTVAGQSAPGDGICLANYTFRVEASNVIVRNIRCRLGDVTKYADDAMDGNGTSPSVTRSNIIIDHCSMSWCLDEAGSFYDNKNFTMQWCILSESLYHSFHPKGDHGYGGIWGGQGASFHHNLLAHHTSRNPRFCGSRYTGDSTHEIVDFRNNVIYNWGNINTAYGGEAGNYNMINNYYKYGPATPNSKLRYRILNYTTFYYATDAAIYPDTVWGGKFYVNGNYVTGYAKTTADNWLGQGSNPGVQIDNSAFTKVMANGHLTAPITVDTVTTQTAQDAYVSVLANAGAIMPRRDTIDRRIARETLTGTATYGGHYYDSAYTNNTPSGIIDSQTDVGGWPTLNSRVYATDSDNDGMPDEWETQRGLNPANATDRNNYTNGYTNLENFLNGDSIVAFGTLNTCVTSGNSLSTSTSGSWLNLKDTSFIRLISTDTMNVIASVKDDGNYGTFTGSYYVTNSNRSACHNSDCNYYLNRNVTITPLSTISSPVTVRLYFTKAEFDSLKAKDRNISSVNDLAVFLYNSQSTCNNNIPTSLFDCVKITPTAAGVWGTYQTGYYVEFSTASFGTFYLASNLIVTPLKLVSFNAVAQSKDVKLAWQTANEVNTKNFVVQRSVDGSSFSSIGYVTASNYAAQANYTFTDTASLTGVVYYRLQMMDVDGGYTYSNTVLVNKYTNDASYINISPNPVTQSTATVLHAKAAYGATISVTDISGQHMFTSPVSTGAAQTIINVSLLPKGMYMVTLNNGGTQLTTKFVK